MSSQERAHKSDKAAPHRQPARRTPSEHKRSLEPGVVRSVQAGSHPLRAQDVRQLQRVVGNRATGRILRARRQQAAAQDQPVQRDEPDRENNTGLPDSLKAGIENLSGMPIDDVQVHYNSSRPAALQALAYTQGRDIHVAPGQEGSLAHEAWHVVQQRQGRVQPTMQADGAEINDDPVLEAEADAMGRKAERTESESVQREVVAAAHGSDTSSQHGRVVQRQTYTNKHDEEKYRLKITQKKITLKDKNDDDRGFVDFFFERKDEKLKFYLKFIDTESGNAPEGSGALLVYRLALIAQYNDSKEIIVPTAARSKTGFYNHMGFGADPAEVKKWKEKGASEEEIKKWTSANLWGDVDTVIEKSGTSVKKHWSEVSDKWCTIL